MVSVYNPPYTELTTYRTIYTPYRPNGSSRTKKPSTYKSPTYPTWKTFPDPVTPWEEITPFPTIKYDPDENNYPTPPWPKRHRPKTTKTTITTTTTTTTTTLPPRKCRTFTVIVVWNDMCNLKSNCKLFWIF